jgi:DNA repair exonuclease SbcCD ATPase subunit
MITELEATNFKKHKSLHLQFTDGLNLITGPNYTGKSSILHAILYALGGPRAVPGGKAVVTTRGEQSTSVSLTFPLDGHTYKIQRKGSSASICKEGELQAKSSSAVNDYLEGLLGMNMKRFQQLRYGEQKETEALLTLGAAELHKIIQEVSQVDVVERAIAYCSTIVSETKGALSTLPEDSVSDLEGEIHDMSVQLRAMYAELEQSKENNAVLTANLTKATEELDSTVRFNTELQSRADARESMENDLRGLHARNQSLSDLQVRDIKELEAIVSELEPKLTQAMLRQKEAERMCRELAKAAAAVDSLNNRTEDTERLLVQKQAELATMGDYAPVEPYKAMLEEALKEKAVIDSRLAELATALSSSVCPTCKRPYEEDPDHLSSIESEIRELEKALPEVETRINTNRNTIKHNELYLESRAKTESMVSRFQQTLDSQRQDLESAMATHSELLGADWGGEMERAGREATDVAKRLGDAKPELTQAMQLEAERAELWRRIKELTEALAALPTEFEFEPVEPLEARLRQLKEEIDAAGNDYTTRLSTYSAQHTVYKGLEVRLDEARKIEDKRSELQHRQGTASGLSKYLKSNRDRFVSGVWDGVMGYASEFASSCTGGDIEQVTRTGSGSFAYHEHGEEHPIEAASGAQKSIMGLGVQLALAHMIPSPLSVLLLDEPSSDMDPERSLAVSSLLSQENSQLIMVSHRDLDGAAAENTINLWR